jgi:adenylyl-sulfate kinase
MGMKSSNVSWQACGVPRDQRWRALGQQGATVWFTGLPAAGKSTLAAKVEGLLIAAGRSAYLLDGDNLRHGLCGDLGFDEQARAENVRRAGEVAHLFAEAGTVALVALISPYVAGRRGARELHERDGLPFVEVFVNTPLGECERRDPKCLYERARAGELRGVTGMDAPYEPPPAPEVEIRPPITLGAAAEAVLDALEDRLATSADFMTGPSERAQSGGGRR